VSVVIPTFNRAGLVVRAIESVLAQTFRDLELIVVDDASSDNTVDVIGQIDDARLRVVRLTKNERQAHALNVGIAQARGEFVAFLDDDDEWLPNKLEAQLARLAQETDPRMSAVYCRCYVQTSEELRAPRPGSDLPEGDITDGLLRRKMIMTPSAYLVRRGALLEVGGFDESLVASQDLDLWLRLSQAGHHFVIVADPLMIYHAEHLTVRVSTNAVAQLRGFRTIDRRWGRLMRERAGAEFYNRWVKNRNKKLRRRHEKLLTKMMRRGKRRAALDYVCAMWPEFSWAGWLVPRALAIALFGRLPRARKEEPA
jgi:glycosyltransferase involved in cell wall biosynthesis